MEVEVEEHRLLEEEREDCLSLEEGVDCPSRVEHRDQKRCCCVLGEAVEAVYPELVGHTAKSGHRKEEAAVSPVRYSVG